MTTAALEMTAIEDLYRSYGAAVRRRAQSVLGSPDDAEDALQDIFIKAIDHRDGFRNAASPRTWLYRVTMNHCLNVKRDGTRRRRLIDVKVAPATRKSDVSLDARVQMSRLMGTAPDDVRDAAACFYFGGLTQDETAEALGVSRRTVGNRLKSFRDLARAS